MANQTTRLEVATVRAEQGSAILSAFANQAAGGSEIATESGPIPALADIISDLQQEGSDKIAFSTSIFRSVSDGLAATMDQEIFLVQSDEPDEIYAVYQNQNGTAVDTGKRSISGDGVTYALAAANQAVGEAINAAYTAQEAANAAQSIAGTALYEIGVYEAGLVISAYNQLVRRNGVLLRLVDAPLPYTLTGNWANESALFTSIGDDALRQQLAQAQGAGLVGFSVANNYVAGTAGEAIKGAVTGSGMISLEKLGIPADGTDQSAAIQAALTANPYRWITGGNRLYTVKNLNLVSGQRMFNVRLKTMAGNQDFVSPVTINGHEAPKSDIFLCDVWVDGNRINQTAVDSPAEDGGRHGFRILGDVDRLYFLRCRADYCATDGFEFFSFGNFPNTDDAYKQTNIFMVDCHANFNRRHGIAADACFNFVIRNLTANGNGSELSTTLPLNHGARGARFLGELYGRPFDFEDYGIGTGYRNVTIDGLSAYGNMAGPLFHSATDVNDPRFVPRGDIKLSNIQVGPMPIQGSDYPAITFYNVTATKAKPCFTNIEMSNVRCYDHMLLTGVKGLTFKGKLQRTAAGIYTVLATKCSDIRIDALGDDGRQILWDGGQIPPYPVTTAVVSGGLTIGTVTISVDETYPTVRLKIVGDINVTTAGPVSIGLTAEAGMLFRPLSVNALALNTGFPIAAASSEQGVNVFNVNLLTSATGLHRFMVYAKAIRQTGS